MPYRIYRIEGGYKVGLADGGKMSNGRKYLSNKILTKKQAEAQKKAVEISESKKKNVSKSNGTITRRRKVEKKQTSVPAKKKY
jgi:hypothetical protein